MAWLLAVALMALLLGAGAPAQAVPQPSAHPHHFVYDADVHQSDLTSTATERGPPAARETHQDRTAVGRASNGALASPETATVSIGYDYDGGPQFIEAVQGGNTDGKPIEAPTGHLSSVQSSQVAAKSADDAGELVYRVHGGDARQWGHSWTTENPLKMGNARSDLGLPKVNSGDYVTCARVCNSDGVIKRNALPLDGNPGGGPELLFPNPQQQLQHLWTIRARPPL